nr:type I-C CRISPR-associated protein Cas7/Csd2 [Deltaproteobacteria bacterium]
MSDPIRNRYDFVLVFDVKDGNPNGDPDAGNLPRIDPETGNGLVTDVCLKRKVRNYIQVIKQFQKPYDIYIKEKAVLGDAHFEAFRELGISTGEESRKPVPSELADTFLDLALPDGLTFLEGEDERGGMLIVAPDADKKSIKEWLKEEKPEKKIAEIINAALKEAKPRRPTGEETEQGRKKMCESFYDIRTFGAVMSLKSAPNCGQVRGPVQMTFGRSVEPVVTLEHSITRMAVATQTEADKQQGDNRTMGRKNTVPYGAYVAHGFVSSHLAAQTGFGEEDLNMFWKALCNMFEHDRSAARGLMSTQRLIVFKHESALGNAPAHSLFDRVQLTRRNDSKPARDFSDYELKINKENLPSGVSIIELPTGLN